jgi:hypothetical protein
MPRDYMNPDRCPGAPDSMSDAEAVHRWDETTEPVTCVECGATKE